MDAKTITVLAPVPLSMIYNPCASMRHSPLYEMREPMT